MKPYAVLFQAYMHLTYDSPDDEVNIIRTLQFAYHRIQEWCGDFAMTHWTGQQLVFEFARFIYNGRTEEFYPRFRDDLVDFGFKLEVQKGEVNDKGTSE